MSRMRNTEQPFASIVTVTYNAAKTIERTMRSVRDQTCLDYEHIIMDGVSNDNTLQIVRKYTTARTRLFSSPDNGLYDAMNKALGVAKGKYVLFLNSGDVLPDETTLQKIKEAAATNSYPDVLYGQTVLVDAMGKIVGQRHLTAPTTLDYNSFKYGMTVCHQAFWVKREIAPLYDLRYKFSADYNWCIICLQNARSTYYLGNEPVVHYLNEGITTKNHRESLNERFRIMCHYYGTAPTVLRHFGFLTRYLKRRSSASNKQ